MVQLVLASIRSRVVRFLGTFLAIALSASMISAAGLLIVARSQAHVLIPTRLSAPSLVVEAPMIVDQGANGPASAGQGSSSPGATPPPVHLRERPRLPA